MPDRVVVFLDYQNVYWSARSAFRGIEILPGRRGDLDPMKLGAVLTGMGPQTRTLAEVRVYRGMPSPKLDPRSHRAWQRPQEKGIDVALGVDLVDLAHRGEYDVAIVFSLDADLLPALERVQDMGLRVGRPRVEVAAWAQGPTISHRLRTPRRNTWCH